MTEKSRYCRRNLSGVSQCRLWKQRAFRIPGTNLFGVNTQLINTNQTQERQRLSAQIIVANDSEDRYGVQQSTDSYKATELSLKEEKIGTDDFYGSVSFRNHMCKLLDIMEIRVLNASQDSLVDVVLHGKHRSVHFYVMYVFPNCKKGSRQLFIILDGAYFGEAAGESVCTRFISTESSEVIETCSCGDWSMDFDCEHLFFYRNGNFVLNRIKRILAIRSLIHPNSMDVVQLPASRRKSHRLWIWFDRNFKSTLRPTSALAVEKVVRGAKEVPFPLRLQCLRCRGIASKRGRCEHEVLIIEKKSEQQTLGIAKSDVFCEQLKESNIPTNISQTREEILESEQEEEDEMDSYVSSLERHFIRYESDDLEQSKLLLGMEGITEEEIQSGEWYQCWDINRLCRKCNRLLQYGESCEKESIKRIARSQSRVVAVHTMEHGTIHITVLDLICPYCHTTNFFDGASSGLFCLSQSTVYTRELLDYFVYLVCGMGLSFREAFEVYVRLNESKSSEFIRHGRPSMCKRRASNMCFSLYVKKLVFPSEKDLSSLFSCTKCEKVTETGDKKMKAIVIDGTAVGILANLKGFHRPHAMVERVPPNVMVLQNMLHVPAVRLVVDEMFSIGIRNANNPHFMMQLSKLQLKLDVLGLLFGELNRIKSDDAVLGRVAAVVQFVRVCFSQSSNLMASTSMGKRCDMQEEECEVKRTKKFKVRIAANLPGINLRLSMYDVGRCFCTSSLAAGVLCSEKNYSSTKVLLEEFRRIATCEHGKRLCENCIGQVLDKCHSCMEWSPQLCKLARSVCEASIDFEPNIVRAVANAISNLLSHALITKEGFQENFIQREPESARWYRQTHRDGKGLEFHAMDNWIADAELTGEVFPGRPFVRPCIDLGNSSKIENDRVCSKDYRGSKSHSAGIFTAQCACKNPKLLGISIMERNEGVSTALSVILARFKKLPDVVYYDNACNLARTVTCRMPWIHDHTRIVTDRFHYTGHICASVWDPSAYPSNDKHSTSVAESLNRLWQSSASHSRFLSAENLTAFLCVRAALLNLRSLYREMTGKKDLEEENLLVFARNKFPCSCVRCENFFTGDVDGD